ncbi:MAG: hypothetical protein ACK4NU_10055 [Brevundimonas sp.]
MKIVSSFLLLIGALAVLTLGAVGVSASPAAAESPCHETGSSTSDQTPAHQNKAMKAMVCCVACVTAPALDPAARPGPTVAPARLTAPLIDFPAGRLLSPEPGPPRLLIA